MKKIFLILFFLSTTIFFLSFFTKSVSAQNATWDTMKINFFDNNPSTNWEIIWRLEWDDTLGTRHWDIASRNQYTWSNSTSLESTYERRPSTWADWLIHWSTSCVDPAPSLVIGGCVWSGDEQVCSFNQKNINVSYRVGSTPGDNLGPVQYNGNTGALFTGATCPQCRPGDTSGGSCGTGSYRCDRIRQVCNSSGQWVTQVVATDVSNCVGVDGCCLANTDCYSGASDYCGTGSQAEVCTRYRHYCNNSVQQCRTRVVATESSWCANNTFAACLDDSECGANRFCRNPNPCGICELYDRLVGRVFVDVNRNNDWDAGTDVGLGNASVQRAPTGSNNWPPSSANARWIFTSGNGWFSFDDLRNPGIQDVRMLPGEFGLYDTNNCTYTNIIRSKYQGVVEASNVAGEPGHRRNNVVPTPVNANGNPVFFMLRYKEYTLRGGVYVDENYNGQIDPGIDTRLNDTSVIVRSEYPSGTFYDNDTLSSTGTYIIVGPHFNGYTYDVVLNAGSLPAGYDVIGNSAETDVNGNLINDGSPNRFSITVNCADMVNNFLIAKTYDVNGYVFQDTNNNGIKDGAAEPYVSGSLLNADNSPVTTTTNASGAYTIGGLSEGSHTIAIQNLPSDWQATYPQVLVQPNPPSTSVAVGTGCNANIYNSGLTTFNSAAGAANMARCDVDDNILNLHFGIRPIPPDPWTQGIGGDMRADSGLDNIIPDTATTPFFSIISSIPSATLRPGIIFGTGLNLGNNGSDNSALANQNNQYVNRNFSRNIINTSYESVSANLRKDAVSISNFGNSTLNTSGVPAPGVYAHSGNLTINDGANTVPFSGGKYLFLINGDLNINSDISVPRGNAVFFIVSGNINVAKNVLNIQGVFSANGTFTVDGDADPNLNQPLNIQGSVIGRAGKSVISGYVNNRNLDYRNETTPSIQILYRPDFVINSPEYLRFNNYSIREVAPGSKE